MTTLAFDIATTFAADAQALVTGFGRIVIRILTAPVERIANACDVAGVLAMRRVTFRARRAGSARNRRGGLFGCLAALGQLT